ncbi:hypothetical protein XELAEV_18015743mg [Xenopus laevis]|uniref:Uncharacterized protein n=1 Tax=Xenopus laevis TaxID=8355 RepID=A0A974DKG3_XENLA|nr:hypothetical protein XELAEV_18015743mg [Xenopus laevis]
MGRTKKGKKSPEPQDKPQKSHLTRFFQKRSTSCSNVQLDTQAETPSWSAQQMADQVSQAAGSSITEPEPTASPCWESGDDWQLSPLHHTNGAIPVDDAGTSAQEKDDQPYSPVAPYIPEGKLLDLEKRFVLCESRLGQLQSHLDDQENRSRRNNIRIKGLPESGKPPDGDIVIDRAHRELRPRDPNSDIPRDIICRIHFYNVKEALMLKARDSGFIHFESMQLKFFQDLCRNTLRQRRALKPILDLLKERSIKYSWGFPFALIVIKQGKSILIKSHKDIPYFLKALSLPPVAIENWDSLIWESPQPRTSRNTASISSRHSKDTDLTSGHDSPPKRRVLET